MLKTRIASIHLSLSQSQREALRPRVTPFVSSCLPPSSTLRHHGRSGALVRVWPTRATRRQAKQTWLMAGKCLITSYNLAF